MEAILPLKRVYSVVRQNLHCLKVCSASPWFSTNHDTIFANSPYNYAYVLSSRLSRPRRRRLLNVKRILCTICDQLRAEILLL